MTVWTKLYFLLLICVVSFHDTVPKEVDQLAQLTMVETTPSKDASRLQGPSPEGMPSKNAARLQASDVTQTISDGLNFVDKVVDTFQEQDEIKYFQTMTELVGLFVPQLSLITKGISTLFTIFGGQKQDPNKIMVAEFGRIHRRLDAIDKKLDTIVRDIKDEFKKAKFEDQRTKVRALNSHNKRFAGNSNNATKKPLVFHCQGNTMLEMLVHEIQNNGRNSLLEVMRRGNDRRKFNEWSKVIVGTFVEAAVLQVTCLGVMSEGDAEFDAQVQRDVETTSNMFRDIVETLKRVDTLIADSFLERAKDDTDEYSRNNEQMGHKRFADNLYDLLKSKYYWRHWFVGSYSVETVGFDDHTFSVRGNGFSYIRKFNRCLLVVSPNSNTYGPPHKTIEECGKSISIPAKNLDGDICRDLYSQFSDCFENLSLLACVRTGNELAVRYDGGVDFANIGLVSDFAGFPCPPFINHFTLVGCGYSHHVDMHYQNANPKNRFEIIATA